ncbi:hypothetical protein ACS0TY_014833 [Phlomoides rotata]
MADSSELSMKLLVDSRSKRVLFAEASKECVDFLFYILTLPVSTLIRLLGKQRMVGSLANLYKSIETLNECYIQPNKTKDTLLKPVSPLPGYSVPLLSIKEAPATVKQFYRCCNCTSYNVTDDPRAVCSSCRNLMNRVMTYVAPPGVVQQEKAAGGGEGGFVKGLVTYMVMDDLVVKPMSTISSITLLNQFNIKDVLALEEKVVTLGMNQAVKLLKASLETDKVLTNVFLNVNK